MGKSTLIRHLALLLKAEGIPVKLTREPGGSPLGEKIRNLLVKDAMGPWAELFLYEAARTDHLQTTILPLLKKGNWVLCDRFTASSLAYQGLARGLPWNSIKTLNAIASQGLIPELTVFLDVPPSLALKRSSQPNRFEKEGLRFQQKARQGFLRARQEAPKTGEKWLTLTATPSTSPSQLALQVLRDLEKRRMLPKKRAGSRQL